MERAAPVQMRKAMESAEALKRAGILFVAVPVLDEADHAELIRDTLLRLGKIEKTCLDGA